MNQYVNLQRFGRLVRKHSAEYGKTYALGAAVLLGGQLLLLALVTYAQRQPLSESGQAALFALLLLGAGSFFASLAFGQFGEGRQAALALTLPASQLEKYLLAWLVSLPVFLAVFVTSFYLADWLVMRFVSPQPGPLLSLLTKNGVPGLGLLLVLHGLALWGSIFFPRLSFVKTASLAFAGTLVVGVANFQLLNYWVDGSLGMAVPFTTAAIKGVGPLNLPDTQLPWLAAVPLALAALLWAAAYARLTEKQL
ncbi:hypothetical protein GCM10027422_13200 [Hymenobacter arcticus]